MNNYTREIARLIREGEYDKAMNVLKNGMKAISEELKEFVNRHSGDWPIVIALLKMTVRGMENSLSVKEKMELALISAVFESEMEVSGTEITVDEVELKRQMEGMERDG